MEIMTGELASSASGWAGFSKPAGLPRFALRLKRIVPKDFTVVFVQTLDKPPPFHKDRFGSKYIDQTLRELQTLSWEHKLRHLRLVDFAPDTLRLVERKLINDLGHCIETFNFGSAELRKVGVGNFRIRLLDVLIKADVLPVDIMKIVSKFVI